MNIELSNHTFLKPFKEFLNLASYQISVFLNLVGLKDNSIFDILSVLAKYKAYDILLPLNVIINNYFDAEQLEWWNENIENVDCKNEISVLTNNLYNKLLNSEKIILIKELSNYENFNFTSIANIENAVWEVCNEYYVNILQDDTIFEMCLFTSGLYSNKITSSYWESINEKVFPQLFGMAQRIYESITPLIFEEALIKRTIYIYGSELGVLFYNIIGRMAPQIMACDKNQLERISYKNLTRILEETMVSTTITEFYFNEQFVENLYELYSYTEKYQLNSFSCRCIEICLPVLLQCVGKYKEAAEIAMNCINQMSVREKANEIVLLALYIAMFTTDSNTQSRICIIIEEICNSKYQLNKVIDVIKDIIVFFDKFSKELPMRFDNTQIEQIKLNDRGFYAIYEFSIQQDEKKRSNMVNSAYWLSKNLFGNKKITNIMKELLNTITDENLKYSERLISVTLFYQLFFSLASHLDTEVRICIKDVCRYINIQEYDIPKKIINEGEIFNIYNNYQIKELCKLANRLKEVVELIPNFNSVTNYERNLSDCITNKILDLNKNKIGFDYKKVFIIDTEEDNK